MGLSAGLDSCGESHPHRDSIPQTASPCRLVAIPTELPGPHIVNYECKISVGKKKKCVLLCTNDVLGHGKVGNKCPRSKESVKKCQQSISAVGQLAALTNE